METGAIISRGKKSVSYEIRKEIIAANATRECLDKRGNNERLDSAMNKKKL